MVKRDAHKKNRRKVEAFAPDRAARDDLRARRGRRDALPQQPRQPATRRRGKACAGYGGDEWEKTSEIREVFGEHLPSFPHVRTDLNDLAGKGEVKRDPSISGNHARSYVVKWWRKHLI